MQNLRHFFIWIFLYSLLFCTGVLHAQGLPLSPMMPLQSDPHRNQGIWVLDGFGEVHILNQSPPEITITLPGDIPLAMVRIPAGSFLMGRYSGEQDSLSNEDPQHPVTIGYEFYLGKYTITQAQWKAVMGTVPWTGRGYVLDDPNSPAVYITWNDAQEFVWKLNQLGLGSFRLPSEAEWEYACRAGTTTRFYWGDDPHYTQISQYAWWQGNAWNVNERYVHLVGLKLPNAWGLYDMSGNVWEWCEDDWHNNYNGAPTDGSAWINTPRAVHRVMRGSSMDEKHFYCRSAFRGRFSPGSGNYNRGFRIAWSQ